MHLRLHQQTVVIRRARGLLLKQAAQLLLEIALEDALLKEMLVGLVLLLMLRLLLLDLLLLILLLELGGEEPDQITVVGTLEQHLLVLLLTGDIDRVNAFICRLLAYVGDQLELLLRDLLLDLFRGEDGSGRSLLLASRVDERARG